MQNSRHWKTSWQNSREGVGDIACWALLGVNAMARNNSCLSVRVIQGNLNHHLWNNNGTWWLHYTLHLPDYTKRRIRKSLSTRSLEAARAKRDTFLTALAA